MNRSARLRFVGADSIMNPDSMNCFKRAAGALLVMAVVVAGGADAQIAVFPTAEPGRWARAEAGRPYAESPTEGGSLSAAWFFTFTTPIPGGVVMVLDVPMAHVDAEGNGASSTAVGNPYVGARMQFNARILTEFEIGIRLPLATSEGDALGYGLWADLTDRPEAFHPRAMPLTLRAVRTVKAGPVTALDLAAGTIWWLMAGPDHTEQNIFVTYSGQGRTELGPLHLAAGASGRYSALGTPIEALRGATHQISASMDVGHAVIRPGVFVTVPVTQPAMSRYAATLGFRLLVPLGG
jgi:hypothetical protein